MSTIKEVAQKANVSVTTVSRVINNKGYVHEDTRKIINDAIIELNYSSNAFAQGLSSTKKNLIGVIVTNVTDTLSSKILETIELQCNKNNIKTIIAITRNSHNLEKYYFEIFKKYCIEGLIITNQIINPELFKSLNIPIVSVNHIFNNNLPSIQSNEYNGGVKAANELINNNCTNILIVKHNNDSNEKIKGFTDTINSYNINYHTLILDKQIDRMVITEYLKVNKHDGIYTTNDLLAISFISELHKLKIKIPSDCCVIGSDNSSFSSLISPTLSSINYKVETLGNIAIEKLLKLINKETIDELHTIIDVELIKRESTTKE